MTVRSTLRAQGQRPRALPLRARVATLAAAAALVGALAGSPLHAQPAGASAPAQAAASSPAATQYTVKPGQSLNDVAIAITQSHEKAVLARAARAIFDANPSAFMRGDPSLMKVGAVLKVPPLDATGSVAQAPASVPASASAPAAASAAAHAVASAVAPASASAAPASAPQHASAPAPALAPASAVQHASAPATPAAPASAAPGAAPRAAVNAPAPASAASAPAPASGSSGHAWTGSIQPAASAPAETPPSASGASASVGESPAVAAQAAPAVAAPASPATAAAAAPASAASAARPHTFSSLQQLLALKNRVLMDLQRHGFGSPGGRETAGKPVGASGAASGAVAQAPGSAQGSATAHGLAARAAGANERFIGIGGYGVTLARDAVATVAAIAAAAVAALLVVVAGLAVGRRKRRAARAAAADEALQANASSPPVRDEAQPGRASAPPPVTDDPVEAEFLATLARTPTSKRALMGLAAHYAERRNARGFDEIAQRIWRLSGGRGPNWIHIAALGRQLDPDNALYAVSGTDAADTFVGLEPDDDDVLPAHSTAAQQQAAAQPAEPVVERRPAEAEPPVAAAPETPVEPASVQPEHGAPEQPEASAVESEPLIQPESVEPGEAQAAHIEASEAEPEPAASAREEPIEPAPVPPASARAEEALAEEAPHERPTQPAMPFPPEAIAALNALDLGLPPRSESPAPGQAAPEAAHPAGEPEELEQTDDFAERERRLAPQEPAVEAAPAEQAGPAEPVEPAAPVPPAQPAVAGLGAAPFGALDLAFDLDLPGAGEDGGERRASPAPAQPMFTPEQMARIARNKLELASEYIALGDLGGARTLIHEVIESNDPATHDEAKALLATLAPLS